MFPQIVKNKKKIKIGADDMIKQCDTIMKEIDFKSKKAVKNISNELVSDFHKVCRLKDISSFYSQYFFYFIQKSDKQYMEKTFAQQVQNIMLGKSYYQKIQELLKQRSLIINEIKQQMLIVQGFSIMNSGKTVPHTIKGLINNLIKDCSSLDQVKYIQASQVEKLAEQIKKVRNNLKLLVEIIISWEFKLKNFKGAIETTSMKKMKVIYPQNNINCIFQGLYDTQFLKSSFLGQQLRFSNAEFDPFILGIEGIKKTSKIFETKFLHILQQNKLDYKKAQQYILGCIPRKQSDKEKQQTAKRQVDQQIKKASKSKNKLDNTQRPTSKDKKRLQNKLKDQYLNQKLLSSVGQNPNRQQKIQNLKKIIISNDAITNVYKKKSKKKIKDNLIKQLSNQKSLSRSRSKGSLNRSFEKAKSVIFLQQRQVTVSQRSKGQKKSSQRSRSITNGFYKNDFPPNKNNNSRIQNVYKRSNHQKSLANISSSKVNRQYSKYQNQKNYNQVEKIINQKKQLIKELQKQKREQEALKKIIGRIQNRTSSQNRFLQQKAAQYQKQINQLKERIRERDSRRQKDNSPSKIGVHNAMISKVYQKGRINGTRSPQNERQSPQKNLMQSRLMNQKNQNKLLQSKINELTKQKVKLQRMIQKEGVKASKQRQIYERKIQKYKQMISKVKNQSSINRIDNLKQKKYSLVSNQLNQNNLKQRKDKILSLYSKRSNSTSQRQIFQSKSKRQNNDKSKLQIKNNDKARAQANQQKNIPWLKQQNKKYSSELETDLKITNNKNTIQIVYMKNKKKRSVPKQSQNQTVVDQVNKSLIKQKQRQYELQKSRLLKERQLLQRKLDIRMNSKSGAQVQLIKQLKQSQQKIQKYKQLVQKQKINNLKYEAKIKQTKKAINEEFETKLERERTRFQKQKQHLFKKIKQQKQSKLQKDKYLSKQMIFLKQMQMRQNQLLTLLQRQRQQRLMKQQQLEQELLKKQQKLQQYEIQEIKRIIQKQVREQMKMFNQQDQQQQAQNKPENIQAKKLLLQKEIKQMIEFNDYQLQQIDQENQKLKQLIFKIKSEEEKIIQNLKADIQLQSQQNENQLLNNYQNLQTSVLLSNSKIQRIQSAKQSPTKDNLPQENEQNKLQNSFQRNESLLAELKFKSDLQISRQKMTHSRYKAIEQSPTYKERQKIQNIIQHYLKNPHQYPSNKSIVMKKQQKDVLVDDLVAKSKKAKQFQQQLMELRNVQSFVPAQRDDPITNHMLNLRQAYENQQAQSLRRILFPSINQQEKYGQDHELSFQSQDPPPPITMMDHVKIHEQNYLEKKKQTINKKSNKNFMAINRMKLLQIQQEKKQKQRILIQQQGKKKARKIMAKSKKKQQRQLKQFLQIKKQLQQKQKKRQKQLQKAKQGVQKLNQQQKQVQKGQQINDSEVIQKEGIEQKNKSLKKIQIRKQKQEVKQIQNLEQKRKQPTKKVQVEINDKNKILKQQKQSKNKDKSKKGDNELKPVVTKDNNLEQQNQLLNGQQMMLQKINKQSEKSKVQTKNNVDSKVQNKNTKAQSIKQQKMVSDIQQIERKESDKQKQQIKQKDPIKQKQPIKQQEQNKEKQSHIRDKQSQQHKEAQINNIKLIQKKEQQQKNGKLKMKQLEEEYQDQFQPQIQKQQKQEEQENQFLFDLQTVKQPKNNIKTNEDLKKLTQLLNPKSKQQKTIQLNEKNQLKKPQQQQKAPVKQTSNATYKQQDIQQPQNEQNQLNKDYGLPSQNIALVILQKQKQDLKSDLLSYQQQIRSYISSYSQFSVYQHFVVQKQLQQYIAEIMDISSQEIKNLNNNKTLMKDINEAQNIVILIAKDKQTNLELGIGLFHKEYQEGEYICDYLLAHNMKNFLNLTFNFSRFIYQSDKYCHSCQFIFTTSALQDQLSKLHFSQFQDKCKRLGEVYVKGKQSNTRKYVLKRILFENMQIDQQNLKQEKGVKFSSKIQIHQNLMKQRNQGYINKINQSYCSPTILLSLFLKDNPQILEAFKKRTEDQLKYRQTLFTAMVFDKKQFSLKSVQNRTLDTEQKLWLYKNILSDKFNVEDIQQNIQQYYFNLNQLPPKKFKRCILQINQVSEPYCFVQFNEPVNQAQASNSAEIGTFLSLVPKFKILVIPGGEFLASLKNNPDMNVFFYTKHFVKNITEVKKEKYSRVYLPEVNIENWTFYKNISQKLNMTLFNKQELQIGFQTKLNNSVIFTPHHKDLVFEKPFIISVLSANIQRAIQGSPIFCKLVI